MIRFFVVLSLFCTSVSGAPAPKAKSLAELTSQLARKTGQSEETVRKTMVEALRESKGFSAETLKRIGRGEAINAAVEAGVVTTLRAHKGFQARIGTAAKQNAQITSAASKEFAKQFKANYSTLVPLEAWRTIDPANFSDLNFLIGEVVLLKEEGKNYRLARVLRVPGIRFDSGFRTGRSEVYVSGSLILQAINGPKLRYTHVMTHQLAVDIRIRPNAYEIDTQAPERDLLVVGDIFKSATLVKEARYSIDGENGDYSVNKQKLVLSPNAAVPFKHEYLKKSIKPTPASMKGAKWIVVATELSGAGSAHNDTYPDGWGVWARRLKDDGSIDPDGQYIFFRQTGPFNDVVSDVKTLSHINLEK